MTNVDEHLLTAAKLREQIRGEMDGDDRLLDHTGMVTDDRDRSVLSFLETADVAGAIDDGHLSFTDTDLGQVVTSKLLTDELTAAVESGNSSLLSYAVGITEQDLQANEFTYVTETLRRVRNNDAPLFLVGFGLPNTGKTGHILHDWYRAWKTVYPDGLAISNAQVRSFDECITSLDELVTFCLDHPDTQKFVFVDEGSTHFDARTNSYEVASQFSPFSKRFAKLSVDFATIGHTVKDVHPEVKRQATTFFYKPEKKQVQFFEDYADDDLLDPVFPDPVDGLEKPPAGLYDPDDWSPLHWDLDEESLVEPVEKY